MPFGTFLDVFPALMFVGAHVAFIAIGLWAIQRAKDSAPWVTGALWLYVASQPVFLMFLGGLITLKMAVLTEQTLLMVAVVWLALAAAAHARRA